MTDLVERLRKSDGTYDITTIIDRCHEAADEIDRLRAQRDDALLEAVKLRAQIVASENLCLASANEIDGLRQVLRWVADHSNDPGVVREARAALAP